LFVVSLFWEYHLIVTRGLDDTGPIEYFSIRCHPHEKGIHGRRVELKGTRGIPDRVKSAKHLVKKEIFHAYR
jgi:hypothetical protein